MVSRSTHRRQAYAIDYSGDGILVDDAGADSDLTCRGPPSLRSRSSMTPLPAGRRQRKSSATANRATCAAGSRVRSSSLHIKRYSESRRKAPIYWQLATPNTSYSAWLYYHHFTRDTLFRLLNDHVAPKLQHEERKLTSLTQDAGPNPTSSQRKEIDAQESFVAELRVFRDEVARVAPLWNPDPNDGVIINFAPLWRLVPWNRSWQKECKKVWDKLAVGDYDWAHLAMHLWPERVVPKCAKDRSLAIAHGLEEIFWEEDDDGKWCPDKVSGDAVDRLIADRTSAAVKSALDDLLRAPAATASPRRRRGSGRRRRAASGRTATASRRASATGSTVDEGTVEAVREAIAAAADGASKSDVVQAIGISSSEWNAAINALLVQGVVTKTGAARGTRYHLPAGSSGGAE